MASKDSLPAQVQAARPSQPEIEKIRRVDDLRKLWPHEAYDFTRWLEQNVDVLNDALDINLVSVEREQAAGSFSVDLVAEDEDHNRVVIENQLEKSDHDHLGKILTYLAQLEADAAIWIVREPRPEHTRAIAWLNESSADFYLLKVEAIAIGSSQPAPLLTLIVGPSEETRQVRTTKRELGERYELRLEWWTQLLKRANAKTPLHATISPRRFSYLGTSAGKPGLSYNYSTRQHETVVELYIDRGRGAERENLEIFEGLKAHRDEIERVFGNPLSWEALEGKRACVIRAPVVEGGYRDPEDRWPTIQDAAIERMMRLESALRTYIAAIPA